MIRNSNFTPVGTELGMLQNACLPVTLSQQLLGILIFVLLRKKEVEVAGTVTSLKRRQTLELILFLALKIIECT